MTDPRLATRLGGEADFAVPAELIGHPARAAMLLALVDGRALPMSMLASEAGIAASTASEHLGRLVDGGLLRTRKEGRHRYYELASAAVAEVLEQLARLAPPRPVRSLRAGTRAAALRFARSCYDHIGGHLGVALMRSLLDREAIVGGDGRHHEGNGDRLSAPGRVLEYRLTGTAHALLTELGTELPMTGRRTVGYCVDWTEQRHHLAGTLGAVLLRTCEDRGWIVRDVRGIRRAIGVTEPGRRAFAEHFGIDVNALTTG
ncbi:ArsR/SmtB family transcription factor [Sciscionella sediminilitoris]|uniref:ArsR/SmtB family transcription factor n=1 Tax=Sciscionella sediminilitoris TaxID=1445613 RepID=UPI0004DF6C56|nr:helix-turn-helix domain-containing protein [Sciscionella sp. SE31]